MWEGPGNHKGGGGRGRGMSMAPQAQYGGYAGGWGYGKGSWAGQGQVPAARAPPEWGYGGGWGKGEAVQAPSQVPSQSELQERQAELQNLQQFYLEQQRQQMEALEQERSALYNEKQDFQQKKTDAIERKAARQEALAQGEARLVVKEKDVTGTVKTYNATKRFGFLISDAYPNDIFVYQTHLVGRIALQQGEEVIFDLVMDNGRPQGRNVRATQPEKELSDVAGDTAQQLFPKGTIVEVAGHPLDEWNGKQGTIQQYDRVQKHFVVDFGKMKLNLKAEFLRFHANAPDSGEGQGAGESAPKAAAKKDGDIDELSAELTGYTLNACEGGEHDQLAAGAGEAVSVTHQAGEWMYSYVLSDPNRVGWLHRDNFTREQKQKAPEGDGGTPSNESEWVDVAADKKSPAGDAAAAPVPEQPEEKPPELKGKEALDWLWSGRDKKP